jgi:hypothetical protein
LARPQVFLQTPGFSSDPSQQSHTPSSTNALASRFGSPPPALAQ